MSVLSRGTNACGSPATRPASMAFHKHPHRACTNAPMKLIAARMQVASLHRVTAHAYRRIMAILPAPCATPRATRRIAGRICVGAFSQHVPRMNASPTRPTRSDATPHGTERTMAIREHLPLRVWKPLSEHIEANACGIRKISPEHHEHQRRDDCL
ncbi:uncharacterized protein PSANT_03647 [Moesziomyces antarcticus]|uniref:Uncharacterized protein n=1 Tax=Pseudozyma antarctica TaxID=84753 RepID=A0A5C3FR44_PSEA2|nr:uncharacterized protein PSANT_03647 [Moesziomyces antarcticus]